MNNKRYGVGLIGAGGVAGEYVKVFRDHPLTEIIGIYNRTPGKASRLLETYGVEGEFCAGVQGGGGAGVIKKSSPLPPCSPAPLLLFVASLKFANGAVGKLTTMLEGDTPYIFNCRLFGSEGFKEFQSSWFRVQG